MEEQVVVMTWLLPQLSGNGKASKWIHSRDEMFHHISEFKI